MESIMKYDKMKKTNRFAERTLTAFSETLFILLEQKAFEEISVNEMCEKCNYPRATFYNYFQDIYDLLDYCWQTISDEIQIESYQEYKPEERTQVLFEKLYTFFDKERERIQKIMKHNAIDGALAESLKRYMLFKIRTIMQDCPHVGKYPIPFEIVSAHYSNTLQLILEWCFFQKAVLSKETAWKCMDYLLGTLEREGEKI
jgi:AcrR family transcriptional regulator